MPASPLHAGRRSVLRSNRAYTAGTAAVSSLVQLPCLLHLALTSFCFPSTVIPEPWEEMEKYRLSI